MERVAFLIESTGERIPALLNPESLQVTRRSGLRTLAGRPGAVVGAGQADDVLVSTGGGRTEIELDLVFDVDLVLGEPAPTDVRDLTGPIWRLSENSDEGRIEPFRMIWGKRWNVPLVVEAVGERFDRFDADGNPLRSWLRMRALRVAEHHDPGAPAATTGATLPLTPRAPTAEGVAVAGDLLATGGPDGVLVDTVATQVTGGPSWRDLIDANPELIDDLPWIPTGTVLRLDGPTGGTVEGP
jgi:hypothetical protein